MSQIFDYLILRTCCHAHLLMAALLLTVTQSLAQADKWILNPNEIDFGAGTSSPLNTGAGTPYKVENAVYKNGVLQFYANDGVVYDPAGNNVGQFANNPGAMLKEVAVAPGPGSCDTWCLFWLETSPLATLDFLYQEVKIENGAVVFGPGGEAGDGTMFGNVGGIAVSHIVPGTNADRDIYVVAFDAVRRFRLSSLGVALVQTIAVQTGGNDFICEADLSHDGSKLGWANGNRVFSMNTAPPHAVSTVSVGTSGSEIRGVEYSPDNLFMYLSHSVLGLRRWPVGGTSTQALSETNTYNRTQLEMGKDGYVYAVRNDGVLGQIKNLAVQQSPLNLKVFSDVATPVSPDYFGLPDQVDGESYSLFVGVPPLAFNSYTVNGQQVFDFIDPTHPPLLVYNCAPINLETTLSGTPSSYSIHVYSTDPATGLQISGPGYLDYMFNGTGVPPSSIDLRCLQGPACQLFDTAISAGHYTFAVVMTLENRCESLSMLGHIKVFAAPAPAQIGLEVNSINGIPCPASHNIASPCLAGIYSASLNFGNSQGDITFYQLTIDEVNCSTGNVIANIYTGQQVPVSGVGSLTALPLNGLVINGNMGFFANPAWLNRCLRITAVVGNPCGSSTDFTYLKFDGQYLGGSETGDRSAGEPEAKPGTGDTKGYLKAFPNPFSDELTISLFLAEEAPVTVTVVAASGRVVAMPCDHANLPAGRHLFSLQGKGLPPGVYTAHLASANETSAIKVIKIH